MGRFRDHRSWLSASGFVSVSVYLTGSLRQEFDGTVFFLLPASQSGRGSNFFSSSFEANLHGEPGSVILQFLRFRDVLVRTMRDRTWKKC